MCLFQMPTTSTQRHKRAPSFLGGHSQWIYFLKRTYIWTSLKYLSISISHFIIDYKDLEKTVLGWQNALTQSSQTDPLTDVHVELQSIESYKIRVFIFISLVNLHRTVLRVQRRINWE